MQQHGFARNLEWEIGSTSADLQPDDRDPEVELVLTDNDYTRAMWYAPRLMRNTDPATSSARTEDSSGVTCIPRYVKSCV